MSINAIPEFCCVPYAWTTFNVFLTSNPHRMIYIENDPAKPWHPEAVAYRVRVKLKVRAAHARSREGLEALDGIVTWLKLAIVAAFAIVAFAMFGELQPSRNCADADSSPVLRFACKP